MTIKLEEAYAVINSNKQRCDRLIENWGRTDIGNVNYGENLKVSLRDLPIDKARIVANALSLQEAYMKQRMNETLVSSAFGTTPENVLKIITLGVANSVRSMIFYEYALASMHDVFFWIHKEREQALRGASAGDNIFEVPNRRYAGESVEVDTPGDNSSTDWDIDTGYGTIIKDKVIILLDGVLCAYTDVEGNFNIVSNDGINVVDNVYNEVITSTGHVKVKFASAIPSTSTITVIAHWDSEDKTLFANNLGTVSMSVEARQFKPRQMPLGYRFTDLTALTIGTTGLGDVHDILVKTAAQEHAMARDYRAIQLAKNIANTNKDYKWNANFAAEGEVSYKSHAQRILNLIKDIGGDIQDILRRGAVNKIIAGSKASTYLGNHERWSDDFSMPHQGIYKVGMLGDIDVFFCPETDGVMAPNEMLVSFKNQIEETDCPVIFGNLTELNAELRTPDLRTEGTIATVEDAMILEKNFIRKVTIENL